MWGKEYTYYIKICLLYMMVKMLLLQQPVSTSQRVVVKVVCID